MKRFLVTLALVGLMAVETMAGDISTSGSPAPPPGAPTQTTTSTSGDVPSVPGDIPTDGVAEQMSSASVSALLTVLGLLSA